MGRMSDEYYRTEAARLYAKQAAGKKLEVVDHGELPTDVGPATPGVYRDEMPVVSRGTNPGAWVMLWAWVPDPPQAEEGNTNGES